MGNVSLWAQHLVKRFGGVVALSDGNLEVKGGEVMALVGANGSGKSTLGKIVTGVLAADGGQVLLNGQPFRFSSPHKARLKGIVAVYQELSLVPRMTVEENIWLGHETVGRGGVVKRRLLRERTVALLDFFHGVVNDSIDPDSSVAELPPSERQIVEILKALAWNPSVMVLDEATASLDLRQVNRLFELIADWKRQGVGIVFISHRMDEIYRVADRVTVLCNGRTMACAAIDELSRSELVKLMIEGDTGAHHVAPAARPTMGEKKVEVRDLSARVLRNVNLEVRSGELVGLAGLHGQGQSELLLALFGAIPYSGQVRIGGRDVTLRDPNQAIQMGIAYVPGDRNTAGLLLVRSILENLQLPSWDRYGTPINMRRARQDAMEMAEGGIRLVMAGLDAPVSSLSGGNAQKVVLGKWLLRQPKVLLLDDPTKGVDVGSKAEFYRILSDLRAQGASILFYSSDDEELLSLCDRILVLHDGQVTAELSGDRMNHSDLVAASVGGALPAGASPAETSGDNVMTGSPIGEKVT